MGLEDFRTDIRALFEAGRQHPIARFMYHADRGQWEEARVVAEEGPAFLTGSQRISFSNMVSRHFPEEAQAEREKRDAEEERLREERGEAVGANLKRLVADKRERKLAYDFEPVRGWNTPLRDTLR